MKPAVGIIGTGSYLPERILTSEELAERLNISHEWIIKRTGILERRIADDSVAASDIGLIAAQNALKDANLKGEDVQLIIVATITPDMIFPTTACILQAKLSAKRAAAFDILAACSGFIYAIDIAASMIGIGNYDNALVVAVDLLSRITDWTDAKSCVLFGDGAGACVLGKVEEGYGLQDSILAADGTKWNILYMPAGGSRMPASYETVSKKLHTIKMQGREVFREAIINMAELVKQLLKKNNLTSKNIDLFIPHQANFRIIQSLAEHLKIPLEKVAINIERYGNMSAASCSIALDEAAKSGRIKKGSNIVMVAFGGGLTYAANLLRWCI